MRLKRHTVSIYQTNWQRGRYRYLAPGANWAGGGGMPQQAAARTRAPAPARRSAPAGMQAR